MLSPQAGVTLLPVSDRARQGPSCISTQVVPSRHAPSRCWHPSTPRAPRMERGESTPTPVLCAEGSNPQRRAHAAQRLLARSRLASGQLKTQPEQFLSICTHGPLLLRVQFEVKARTILFLGTMPWARSVWSRRFDVLKKKKKQTSFLTSKPCLSPTYRGYNRKVLWSYMVKHSPKAAQ